jgi:hypothetical protein
VLKRQLSNVIYRQMVRTATWTPEPALRRRARRDRRRPHRPGSSTTLDGHPCHHAGDRRLRPHCDGAATVQYGRLALGAGCDVSRSTVGKGQNRRRLDAFDPDDELRAVAHAQRQVREAEQALSPRPSAGRDDDRSWADIGDALGVTRQAAQQLFAYVATGRG